MKHTRKYLKDDDGKIHTIDNFGSMSEAIKNKSFGHCYMCKMYLPIMCLTKCKCGKWYFRLESDLPVVALSEAQAKEIYDEFEESNWHWNKLDSWTLKNE